MSSELSSLKKEYDSLKKALLESEAFILLDTTSSRYSALLLIVAGGFFEQNLTKALSDSIDRIEGIKSKHLKKYITTELLKSDKYFRIFDYKRWIKEGDQKQLRAEKFLEDHGIINEHQTPELVKAASNLTFITFERNKIAHNNDAGRTSVTPDEVYEKYESAKLFLDEWRKVLGLPATE